MMSFKNKLSAPGVPIWATVFLFIVVVFGFVLGVPALLGIGLMETHTIGWGGRELGVAVGAVISAILRNPTAYFLIFVIGIFRETSDALEALAETPPNTASVIFIGIFVVIGAASALVSYRAMRAAKGDTR
ncbi:hypothetical protein [uncultured Tateyamaria sp.]|uniref:hypothetical protein n=1 Tax=uncultured Tateyamaria sp. TaxID=455651 RepID=UPI0026355E25|nr:hypothetical protein [uncultured Tateyamaria sp.]